MVSGKYLGEITRIIISKCLYGRKFLNKIYSFDTRHMAIISSDRSRNLTKIASVLKEFTITDSRLKERQAIKKICDLTSKRAARIFAALIVATLTKNDSQLKRKHTVLIDGSVYQKYPQFSKITKQTLKEILKDKSRRISLVTEKDATGIGAAVIAAVAING